MVWEIVLVISIVVIVCALSSSDDVLAPLAVW